MMLNEYAGMEHGLLRRDGHKWAVWILAVQDVENWVDVERLQGSCLCKGGLFMANLFTNVSADSVR